MRQGHACNERRSELPVRRSRTETQIVHQLMVVCRRGATNCIGGACFVEFGAGDRCSGIHIVMRSAAGRCVCVSRRQSQSRVRRGHPVADRVTGCFTPEKRKIPAEKTGFLCGCIDKGDGCPAPLSLLITWLLVRLQVLQLLPWLFSSMLCASWCGLLPFLPAWQLVQRRWWQAFVRKRSRQTDRRPGQRLLFSCECSL